MDKSKQPLKLALHGMDSRTTKAMMLFLQGPCKGAAVVIGGDDADVDLFDADMPSSKILLDSLLSTQITRPLIVISLKEVSYEGAQLLRKPIKTSEMLLVLSQAKKAIKEKSLTSAKMTASETGQSLSGDGNIEPTNLAPLVKATSSDSIEHEKPTLKTYLLDQDEQKKRSKHQTAMQLDERSYQEYIGAFEDFDINDTQQISKAYYNPMDYYQGYVQSAFGVSRVKNQILLLQSQFGDLTLFPRTQEIWLDTSDQELREYAGMRLNHNCSTTTMALIPVDQREITVESTVDKFQSIDAFLWKLACWTSRGRYPQDIDFTQPVYLKNWPNFTRVLVTPHALRIAALLVREPRTMANIAEALKIEPQYVFVFISAAYTVGLVDQAKRASDSIVQTPDLGRRKGAGILSRIINKLRGN